jgi:hypothetical protein
MGRVIALVVLLLGAGCATEANFKEMAGSWIGSTEQQLVATWGPPNGFYESGNTRYLSYARSRSGYVPGTAPSYQTTVIGNTAYTTPYGGSPGYSYTNHCTLTFTVTNGIVAGYRYEGNACKA